MASLEYTTRQEGRISLVSVVLSNDRSTRQRIELRCHVDGPIWVPRTNGVREPEWRDETWTGRLSSGEWVGLGFASPGTLEDPPVTVGSSERSTERSPPTIRHVLTGRVPR